jgi:membrane-bound lytic murein transglycosylase D
LPKGFILKIPFRENFDPATAYAQIPGSEKFQNQSSSAWYQVRYGDYLDKIAQEFKMSMADLMAINEISDPHQIYEGQVLKVKSNDTADDTLVNAAQFAQVINRNESLKIEETGPFDVRTFGPQVYEKLIESSPENKATAKIIVQPNETLGHFADWLQLPTQELRKLNKLNFEEEIQVAQEIEVVYSNVTAEVFNRRRLEYRHSIEEDFFATFKVTKINPYKVQKGDNIWTLCNDVFAVPYWLVLRYNPDKDLQNLKPEEIILFPIVENISENASE